jgi:hypothetical protein
MSPETIPKTPLQETLPKPEYVVIESQIDQFDQEANEYWGQMNAAYESADDATKLRIDQLQDNYEAAANEADQKGEAEPDIHSFFEAAGDIPEDYKVGALAAVAISKKIEAVEAELENHASEKAAGVAAQARELEASLDYDKAVSDAFADDDRTTPHEEGIRLSSINRLYEVSRIIAVQKLLESSPPLSYQELKSVEHSLSTTRTKWEEHGLLKDNTDGESKDGENVPLLLDQITDIEAHLTEVSVIRSKYKIFDSPTISQMVSILYFTHQIKESEELPGSIDDIYGRSHVVYNEGLATALNNRLVQKLQELPAHEFDGDIGSEGYAQFVEQAREIALADAHKNLEISGSIENLPFEFSETELRLFLITSVPAVALKSVKRIQFRPLSDEEDEVDNKLGIFRHSKELDGWEIVVSDVKVKENYEDTLKYYAEYDDAEDIALHHAKTQMLRTITHEFGHALHEVLPVAALKRWEDKRVTDPTNITAYVKSRHDEDHPHRYMEDFADSMAKFIVSPAELSLTSSVRYEAMQEIYEEYMPLYAAVTQKKQEGIIAHDKKFRSSVGESDEEARKRYLSHEDGR